MVKFKQRFAIGDEVVCIETSQVWVKNCPGPPIDYLLKVGDRYIIEDVDPYDHLDRVFLKGIARSFFSVRFKLYNAIMRTNTKRGIYVL